MTTRDELKALIDQLPEPSLEPVRTMLDHHVHPPPPRPEIENMPVPKIGGHIPLPEIERIQQRGQEFRRQVLERFRATRRPGTMGTGGGGGFSGAHEGVPFGRQSFHYWDEKALVHQSLQSFDGQEIEVMERLSFSPDRTTLVCSLELSSGGHTVRHEDGFPVSQVKG